MFSEQIGRYPFITTLIEKSISINKCKLISFLNNQTGFNERRHSKRWLLAQFKVAKLLLTHATRLSFEETHSREKIQTGHTRVAGEVSFCRGQFEVPNDKRCTNWGYAGQVDAVSRFQVCEGRGREPTIAYKSSFNFKLARTSYKWTYFSHKKKQLFILLIIFSGRFLSQPLR